jgi:hypothetical protein
MVVGIDPCLGRLPGVKNACCGHGFPQYGYIMFDNSMVIRNFLMVEASLEDSSIWNWMDFPQPSLNIRHREERWRWMGEPYMNHFFNNLVGLFGHPYDPELWNPEVVKGFA